MLSIRSIALSLLLLFSACSTFGEDGRVLSQKAGWHQTIITTPLFDFFSAAPKNGLGDTLWVYIEGDGRAYLTPSTPSSNPTPSDPIALKLALEHNTANTQVAYLARPCQFVDSNHQRHCDQRYWTDARYSADVIESTNEAINVLKTSVKAQRIVLVGYSGGGAIAVLVAAHRNDISKLITVAANLDLAYWTKRDGLSSLSLSRDPALFAKAVASIPQWHFTGGGDDVTGTDVVRSFLSHASFKNAHIIETKNATHVHGWAEQWPELLRKVD